MRPSHQFNFEKNYDSINLGERYDHGSIMHYGPTFFTSNGQYTMKTRINAYQNTIGQYLKMTFKDTKMINLKYCQGNEIIIFCKHIWRKH